MADEKLNTGPAENISPEAAEPIATPEQAAASEPQQEQTGPAIPEPGDVVVSFDKINELMAEKRQTPAPKSKRRKPPKRRRRQPPEKHRSPPIRRNRKSRARGRPPKAEKAATENQKSEKSAGARKAAHPRRIRRPLTSPSRPNETKCPEVMERPRMPRSPLSPHRIRHRRKLLLRNRRLPSRPHRPARFEEGKLVYLKLSEVHPFHTFRPHPFKVRDDAKMQEIVASIRVNGVMVPGLAARRKTETATKL